jgi:hypothetical protein
MKIAQKGMNLAHDTLRAAQMKDERSKGYERFSFSSATGNPLGEPSRAIFILHPPSFPPLTPAVV